LNDRVEWGCTDTTDADETCGFKAVTSLASDFGKQMPSLGVWLLQLGRSPRFVCGIIHRGRRAGIAFFKEALHCPSRPIASFNFLNATYWLASGTEETKVMES
jgi:hypothetical protein